MKKLPEILGTNRIIPVVKIADAGQAADLAAVLQDAGVSVIEITFRTSAAAEAIRRIRDAVSGMAVGAGTVRTTAQVDQAIDSGAEFLVSPGFNPSVCSHALARGVVPVPGVMTPSEVEQASALGLDTLKFFPAEQAGGTAFLRALAPVYPDIRFVPTGGITAENLASYLELPNVPACGGSWMVRPHWIADGDFAAVERATREACAVLP